MKNNGTKYLLFFDDSRKKICNSKAFVDIVTAGRHRGLRIIHIEHTLFQQNKHGRDVELLDHANCSFQVSREMMQVNTLSSQLGLGSKIVHWYHDATCVPDGYFLIALTLRTNHRLRYCTNTGSGP